MANRTIDLPSVFGVDANNVLPAFPTPGSGYRKEPLLAADIQNGWPFSTLVDSSIHNEVMFIMTSLLQQIAQQGNLSWCATTSYVKGTKVLGSDGNEYKAVIANTNVDPTTAPLSTWKPSTGDKPGKFVGFAMNAAPAGYLFCNGAAVSRTLYPDLFAAIGVTWGIGDGGTTFNLPDAQGQFLRGFDVAGAVDPGRAFATEQGHAIEAHTHTDVTYASLDANLGPPAANSWTSTAAGVTGTTGGAETRPVNIAVLICIAF